MRPARAPARKKAMASFPRRRAPEPGPGVQPWQAARATATATQYMEGYALRRRLTQIGRRRGMRGWPPRRHLLMVVRQRRIADGGPRGRPPRAGTNGGVPLADALQCSKRRRAGTILSRWLAMASKRHPPLQHDTHLAAWPTPSRAWRRGSGGRMRSGAVRAVTTLPASSTAPAGAQREYAGRPSRCRARSSEFVATRRSPRPDRQHFEMNGSGPLLERPGWCERRYGDPNGPGAVRPQGECNELTTWPARPERQAPGAGGCAAGAIRLLPIDLGHIAKVGFPLPRGAAVRKWTCAPPCTPCASTLRRPFGRSHR